MNQVVAMTNQAGVIATMAAQYNMDPRAFEATLRATVVPKDCSKEQFAAFLIVAKEYDLNPITKEIYAFPAKGGGIQPVVSVDGWMNLCNSHPQMDGLEFDDHHNDKGTLVSVSARIWRKDRSHPIVVTEYMDECRRETEPWKKWPRRMLRHKAAIQCARYAFGFAGIIDPDEAERMGADFSRVRDVTPPSPPPVQLAPPSAPPEPPAETADPETGEIVDAPAVLPPAESEALRQGLIKQLHRQGSTEMLDAWLEARKPSLDTLRPDDRQLVNDEWSARQAELYEREQSTTIIDAG